MKVKSTKSGFDFQVAVENKLLSSSLFGKDSNDYSNIYGYSELINQGVSDIDKFLLSAEDQMFLIKNYPLNNYIDNSIEFCIKIRNGDVINDCYVECKFHDVNGTAYQKLSYYLSEHRIAHSTNTNSFMVLVYDGNEFLCDTQTRLHVENIRENYIRYDFRQLILEVRDFENQFLAELRDGKDMQDIFVEMKKAGY